jgi:hypothetical protein
MMSMSVDDPGANTPGLPACQPVEWSNPDPASLPGDGDNDYDYKLLNQPAENLSSKIYDK